MTESAFEVLLGLMLAPPQAPGQGTGNAHKTSRVQAWKTLVSPGRINPGGAAETTFESENAPVSLT